MTNKKRIAIIGGGIAGLSIANCLNDRYEVKVFERESKPGGLIRCDRINGNLYHKVGGHVFNSRDKKVLDWFWQFFDQEKEFVKTQRNAVVAMPDGKIVGYPIENHVYMMNENIMKSFIKDLFVMATVEKVPLKHFEHFLRDRFGKTLYELYFKPYNEKIWKKELSKVPLSWLEGKLPMPTKEEMVYNNFNHVKEMNMVHSSFYYAKQNGSQFLADRLAKDIDVVYNANITHLERNIDGWTVNGYECNKIVFCGNIKELPTIFGRSLDISLYTKSISELEYHGTTSVLCEIEKNPYSWIYMPSQEYSAHRIICTGNFSPTNNGKDKMTATIEFTDYVSKEDIDSNIKKIPFYPQYLAHQYTKYTYPIQNITTRENITNLKRYLEQYNVFLCGRFAEWEYYNMDATMKAAIILSDKIKNI